MVSKLACSLSYLTRSFVGHAGHFSKRSTIRGPARDTLRAVIDLVMFLCQLRQESPGEICTNVRYSRHYTVKLRITSVYQWTKRFSEFPIEQHFSSWWKALRYTGLLSMIYEVLILLWTKNHDFLSIKKNEMKIPEIFSSHIILLAIQKLVHGSGTASLFLLKRLDKIAWHFRFFLGMKRLKM